MPDEPQPQKSPNEEVRDARIERLGVKDTILGETPPQPKEEHGGPPEVVPYERVQQQSRQLQELRQQLKETEERAKNWDMLVNDPNAVEILSGYYRGEARPAAGSHPSTAQAEDDEIVDPHIKRIEQKVDQQWRQLMGVLAPIVQGQAEQQRSTIKQLHADYEPKRDDPQINTIMAQGRARHPLDAFRILKAERALNEATEKHEKQAAGTVQAPAGVPRMQTSLRKQTEEAKAKYLRTRAPEDLEAWVEAKGEEAGTNAMARLQFGMNR